MKIDPEIRQHMRVPLITMVVLLVLLGINVLLGTTVPFPAAGYVEMGIAAVMVAIVLLFSMEVIEDPPLIRLFSVLGFFWLAILFGLTVVDYLGR